MKLSNLSAKIAAIFFILFTLPSSAQAIAGKEYQAIVTTAYNYFNGAANGDQKLLAEAFDLEFGHMKMVSTDKETGKEIIKSVPLKEFAGYFSKATSDIWQVNTNPYKKVIA